MSGKVTTVLVAVLAAAAGAGAALFVTSRGGGAPERPRVDGHPNLSGIWQANNEANWDLEGHEARPAALTQPGVYPYEYTRIAAAPVVALGAVGAVPASLGVVQGDGKIPYKPEMLPLRKENQEKWIDRDPEIRCYLPGIPRAMYMPHPFEITHGNAKVHMAYAFANTARTVHLDKVTGPPDDTYMGHSVGRWEGDTLVVDVTNFNGKNWFDRAGNFHSPALKLQERFTLVSDNIINYEVTIEDPKVFTKPWKISMPLYRRVEPNMQLLEFRCTEFAEEFMYGHLRKEPILKKWEGETMTVEVTRKIPPGDKFYEWYGGKTLVE